MHKLIPVLLCAAVLLVCAATWADAGETVTTTQDAVIFTPWRVAGIILLGGVIGFLSGLFGVGGGFLLTPMLNIVFGIPMLVAVGSSLCQMIGTATTATMRHWKRSAVDAKLFFIMSGGMISGVMVGVEIGEALKGLGEVTVFSAPVPWSWLVPMCCFVVLLTIIGGWTLHESLSTRRKVASGDDAPERRGLFTRLPIPPMTQLDTTTGRAVSLPAVAYLGFGTGMLQGLLGVGGGVVIVPALIYWVGSRTRTAVGTSLLVIIVSSIAGTIRHGIAGNVHLGLVALMLISSTTGASLGAALGHRIKSHSLRMNFALVVLVALIVIVAKMLVRLRPLG